MLSGFTISRIEVAGRTAIELLGAGDLVRPWSDDDGNSSIPSIVTVKVCEPTRLAMLDRDFTTTIAQLTDRWGYVGREGRSEALNNKVRLIIRRAYGFHTAHAALALVMLTCDAARSALRLPHQLHAITDHIDAERASFGEPLRR